MPREPTPSDPSSPNADQHLHIIDDFAPLPPSSSPLQRKNEGLVALYAFFPASPAELLAIARACHGSLVASGAWGGAGPNAVTKNILRPAPHALRLGPADATVESVVAYHRDAILRSPGWRAFFDRENLAVAKTSSWRREGVSVVTVASAWLQSVRDAGEAYRRGWDEWVFRTAEVGSVLVNLQLYNMGWDELTTMTSHQPEGQEPDGRAGGRLANMLEEGEEEEMERAQELVRQFRERDDLVAPW